MMLKSEPAVPTTARQGPVTVLHEIDLGTHHLFILSDQSIDLLADEEQAPYVARATTLETVCGRPVCRELLIASLLRSLEEAYLSLQQETTGVLSAISARTLPSRLLWEKWRGRLSTLGRTIDVRQGNSTISGIAEDVDGNGELLLRNHAGELICITWGSVD